MSDMRVDAGSQGAVTVSPSDTVKIVFPSGQTFSKAIYVGGAGNISALMADGSTGIFTAIAVGVVHNLNVQRINATGTTATLIQALY